MLVSRNVFHGPRTACSTFQTRGSPPPTLLPHSTRSYRPSGPRRDTSLCVQNLLPPPHYLRYRSGSEGIGGSNRGHDPWPRRGNPRQQEGSGGGISGKKRASSAAYRGPFILRPCSRRGSRLFHVEHRRPFTFYRPRPIVQDLSFESVST